MAKTDTAHSMEEAEQLAAAYVVRADALKPLRQMLATPGDHFAQQKEDRAANDAAVIGVVDDLVPLAKQTAGWLRWAADQIRRQEQHADEGDEASLKVARTATEALRAPARELADQAVAVLNVAQRAALGRHMVSELGSADNVWWPHAEEERAHMGAQLARRSNYTLLDEFVEQQLVRFRSLPEWMKPPQWMKPRISRKKPIQRRWMALYHPLLVIEANAEEIDTILLRLDRAYQQVVGRRHRAEAEARREKSEREKEAAAGRQALEARRLAEQATDLTERAQAHRGDWGITSRQLRERGWTSLLKQLCDGIRNDDDVLVVPGIPREHAGHVLALVQLAADHSDKTAERLGELLATENDLLHERARLHAAMARWPAEAHARIGLPDLHPDLRRTYEWLAYYMHEVTPTLAAYAPEATSSLQDAVYRVLGTEGSA